MNRPYNLPQRLTPMGQADSDFDASSLEPYTVIRIPQAFGDQLPKRFVVVGHNQGAAVCVKTTSQTLGYKNSRENMESCVFYEKGKQPNCFSDETAVQPNNIVAYRYEQLNEWYRDGTLHVFGILPFEYFKRELMRALDGVLTTETIKKGIRDCVERNRLKRKDGN
jgi:hypothetical protein